MYLKMYRSLTKHINRRNRNETTEKMCQHMKKYEQKLLFFNANKSYPNFMVNLQKLFRHTKFVYFLCIRGMLFD